MRAAADRHLTRQEKGAALRAYRRWERSLELGTEEDWVYQRLADRCRCGYRLEDLYSHEADTELIVRALASGITLEVARERLSVMGGVDDAVDVMPAVAEGSSGRAAACDEEL